MKNATKLLSVLLLSGVFTQAVQAQTAPAAKPTSSAQAGTNAPDCCMMKAGKMMVMTKGGKTLPMSEAMTTTDGCKVLPDGTCKMKNGTTTKMKNGQMMSMHGKMTTMNQPKKGNTTKGSKTGSSKM